MSYSSEVLADSPVGYWRLGEPSGTAAISEVNSPTVDGTYINTPTLGVTGALSGDANTAITLAAASLEGVEIPDVATLDVGDVYSLEIWFKAATLSVQQHLLFSGGAGSWDLYLTTGNKLQVDVINTSALMDSTITISDSAWHHAVHTKNGASKFLYIDGVDRSNSLGSGTMSSPSVISVGQRPGTDAFDGSIDEVAIYSTALSAARVLVHYNTGVGTLAGPFSPPGRMGRGAGW